MNGADRTKEFYTFLKKKHKETLYEVIPSSSPINNKLNTDSSVGSNLQGSSISDDSDFFTTTTAMGQQLASMQQRVTQVEKLVKSRSIFEDHTTEIQATTYEIRQWILETSTQLDILQEKSLRNLDSKGAHIAAHYKSVIQSIRTQLADITMRLKDLLELCAKRMKTQQDRRKIYSHTSGSESIFTELNDPEAGYTYSEKEAFVNSSQEKTQMFSGKRSQPFYYSARAEAIQNVQTMISELAQIFMRVASLVSAQEELSARIEDDMSSALQNLHEGENQLHLYYKSIASNRTLIFKIFGILFIFIFFFVFFLT